LQYTLIIEDRSGRIADELSFERGSFSIGRNEGNDIQLSSQSVSRNHARIFADGERCFVEDLNSSNGIFVDGNRVYGRAPIVAGSQIRVGDFLLLLQAREGAPVAAQRPTHAGAIGYARLIRLGDVLEGETYSLTEIENTIGRTDDNSLLLADPSVSRQHAKIVLDQGRFVVVDLGSSNGTRVNDHLINQPSLLNPGDIVRIGNVRFVFAAPGQRIDLREFNRYVSGSNRGLILAVVVLALMLVLVASGITAVVLIDKRLDEQAGGTPTAPVVPEVSPAENARALYAEGEVLAQQERWNEAIVKYTLARDLDATLAEAGTALARAQREYNTSAVIREAGMSVQTAERALADGNHREAADTYQRVRGQLATVPEDSVYRDRARAMITSRIDPEVVRIHRELAQRAVAAEDFLAAVTHYDQAIQTLEANPAVNLPGVGEDVRRSLWETLIRAADAAAQQESFRTAVDLYERAGILGALPEEVERRLDRARRRL
jgi:pSer/pThr/pTyr-binding forkhead associated (FHA) protein